MFTLVKTLGFPEVLWREAVPLATSLVLAEFLYKFHSFMLECTAFLVTWCVFSYVQALLLDHRKSKRGTAA
jgi:hypothetical protein